MKFIFLDVDGVLNSEKTLLKNRNEEIDNERLYRLSEIVDKTGAEIVLTSTWKIYLNLDLSAHNSAGQYMLNKFAEHGLKLYAVTDDEGMDRGEGIISFLIDNPCDSFVILDDEIFDDFRDYDLMDNIVQTDFYGDPGGLLDEHVEKAIEILNREQ